MTDGSPTEHTDENPTGGVNPLAGGIWFYLPSGNEPSIVNNYGYDETLAKQLSDQVEVLNSHEARLERERNMQMHRVTATPQETYTTRARIKELINLINQEKVDILEGTLGIKVTNISSQALTTWRQQPND